MNYRTAASWLVIASALLLARAAKADILAYQINGTVSQADTQSGTGYTPLFDLLGFRPTLGDALTLTYHVDTNTPGASTSPGSTQYAGALSSVAVSVTHLGQVGTISIPIPQTPDSYATIFSNANFGTFYQSGYYAAVAPINPPRTGDVMSLVFYTIAQSAEPLSPPLYPDTSLGQAPLAAGTPNLSVGFGLNSVRWVDGIFVDANGISATYNSSSVSPVPLPAAAWLLLSALTGIGVAQMRKDRRGDSLKAAC